MANVIKKLTFSIPFLFLLYGCQETTEASSPVSHNYRALVDAYVADKKEQCAEIVEYTQNKRPAGDVPFGKAAQHYLEATCYKVLGGDVSPMGLYKKAYRLNSKDRYGVYEYATQLYYEDASNHAVRVQKKAIAYFPDDVDLYENLISTYKELEERREAIKVYEKIISIAEQLDDREAISSAYEEMGDLAYDESEYEEALLYLNKSIEYTDEPSAWLYNLTGMTHDELDNHEESIAFYNKAIAVDKTFWAAYNNLGYQYNQQDQFDEAIKILNYAIENDVDKEEVDAVYFNLAISYRHSDCKQAVAYLELAIEHGAFDRGSTFIDGISYNLGRCHTLLGHYDEAIKALEQDENKDAETYYYLGRAHFEKKEYAKALEYFEEVEEYEYDKESEVSDTQQYIDKTKRQLKKF
jgi:tetratricopeptide (TPR) repeat protein